MRVSDWMQSDVKAIRAIDSLQHAALSMWTHDVGALPVLGPQGTVVAMITDRDIAMAAALRHRSLDALDVYGTMSKTLWSCAPGDALEDAERTMSDHQVRRLPVIDAEGKLVGILSINDVLRAALTVRKQAPAAQIARTMEAISARRADAVSIAK